MNSTRTSPSTRKLTLFALTWPIFIELLLHMLMGNADTLMLSQYDDYAVASVGVANQLLAMVTVMFSFVSAGTTILVSRYLGGQDVAGAHRIASTSISLNLGLGALFSVILVLLARPLLRMLGLQEELMPDAISYMSIIGSFIFLQSMILTLSAVIKSHGDTRVTMYITIGMNVLNIIGNYLVIFGAFGLPVLGVTGVAISTVVSRAVGLAVMAWYLFYRIRLSSRLVDYFKLKKRSIFELLRIGIPSAGEHLAHITSQLMITTFVTSLGATAIVTRIYSAQVTSFIVIFTSAICQGTQILVSRLVGARDEDGAYKQGWRSLGVAIIIVLTMATLCNIAGRWVLDFFTDDPEVIRIGRQLLLISYLLEVGRAMNMIIIASLRAAGDVRFPVYMGIIFMWGLSMPAAYLFGIALEFGLIGIYFGYVLDEWVRGLLMMYRWRSKRWKTLLAKERAISAAVPAGS